MSRKLKPITQVENAIKHLQKSEQHLDGVIKGHYPNDNVPNAQKDRDHAATELRTLIARLTRPVDYSIPEDQRPEVIRGF